MSERVVVPSFLPHKNYNWKIHGDRAVPVALLKRRLGTAYEVLEGLRICSNEDGLTYVSTAGLTRVQGCRRLTPWQVKRGLAKLRRFGLLQDLGWEHPYRWYEGHPNVAKRYLRVVACTELYKVGDVAPYRSAKEGAAAKLEEKSGWGGPRQGAGRPRKNGPILAGQNNQDRPLPRIQDRTRDINITCDHDLRSFPLRGGKNPARERAAFSSPLRGALGGHLPTLVPRDLRKPPLPAVFAPAATAPVSALTFPEPAPAATYPPAPAAGNGYREAHSPELGSMIGGNARWCGRMPPWGKHGLPPWPGHEVMFPLTTPPPPRLPADLSDDDAAWWLLKAYRGACESRYRKPCYILVRRQQFEASKYRGLVLKAVRRLRDMEIAPAAWAAWSVDVWRAAQGTDKTKKGTPKFPPLHWVYSQSRMDERAGWFRHEEGAYMTPRVGYTAAARKSLEGFQTVAFDVQWAMNRGEKDESLRKVVDKYFPGDSWDRLLPKINAQTLEQQKLIDRRRAAGDWLGW